MPGNKGQITGRLWILFFLIMMIFIEAYVIGRYWLSVFGSQDVPITGLPATLNYIILWLAWPLIGGVIATTVFPRILAPVYLRLKGGLWRTYKNAYLELDPPPLTPMRLAKQFILMALLTMGLTSVVVSYINPQPFFVPSLYNQVIAAGLNPSIHLVFVASVAGIVVPISVGLWSVSWSLRNASLVHHKFPEPSSGELYEVEPIHLKYESLLKGYAGFSSLLFIMVLFFSQG
ncbi:MAG: hypothetical protein ACFFAY_16140, partial [Promethearchaeota archaeon]